MCMPSAPAYPATSTAPAAVAANAAPPIDPMPPPAAPAAPPAPPTLGDGMGGTSQASVADANLARQRQGVRSLTIPLNNPSVGGLGATGLNIPA